VTEPVEDVYGRVPKPGDIVLFVSGDYRLREGRVVEPPKVTSSRPRVAEEGTYILPLQRSRNPRARPFSRLASSERFVITQTADGKQVGRPW
jgi:hypothetical protein